MSIVAKQNKAALVGLGISAAVVGAAFMYLYKKRRPRKHSRRRKSPGSSSTSLKNLAAKQQSKQREIDSENVETYSSENESGLSSSESDQENSTTRRRKTKTKGSFGKKSRDSENTPITTEAVVGCCPLKNDIAVVSWPEELEQAEKEFQLRNLAYQFSSKATLSSDDSAPEPHHECDGEVSKVLNGQATFVGDDSKCNGLVDRPLSSVSPKTHFIESPSLACDRSEASSQDSGKGASMGLTSSMSPVEELIEVPPMYEFEVPQDIVGLLIGRKGTTIKWFTDESGAHIVIRHHHFSDKHKICTIEGTREQINKCLRLIRHKFPPSRFPDLKLTPLLPPPIASPHSPVFDSIIHLKLPESVKCEVVLSSLVDAGHFFVQQPTHPTFPSLSRLDQYMLAVYNQPNGVPGLPRPIDIGVVCAAPVLGGWYRAQTIAMYDETDEVLVKFVDYGGYSKISAMDLRQIRSDFMTLPFQATECCLAHIKPLDSEAEEGWSPRATAFFEDCVHSKVVEALVVGHVQETVSAVELYCMVEDKPCMVNQLLVDNGFAQFIEEETE